MLFVAMVVFPVFEEVDTVFCVLRVWVKTVVWLVVVANGEVVTVVFMSSLDEVVVVLRPIMVIGGLVSDDAVVLAVEASLS